MDDEQLGDTLVEAGELLYELGVLHEKVRELRALGRGLLLERSIIPVVVAAPSSRAARESFGRRGGVAIDAMRPAQSPALIPRARRAWAATRLVLVFDFYVGRQSQPPWGTSVKPGRREFIPPGKRVIFQGDGPAAEFSPASMASFPIARRW